MTEETPRELRRLVEILNDKMADVEVLAVEVRQFVGEGRKALVPRVVGLTEAGRMAKRGEVTRKPHVTREEFLTACPATMAPLFGRVLELASARGHTIYWGTAGFALRASFPAGLVTFMEGYPDPKLTFKFGDLPLPKVEKEALCKELEALAVFGRPTTAYMRLKLEEDQLPRVQAAYEAILQKIDALASKAAGTVGPSSDGAGGVER